MTNDKTILHEFLLTLLVFFAIIGIITLSIGLHEFYHVVEYHNLNITNSQLCVFQLENITYDTSGYFQFEYPSSQSIEESEISKYSEVRAYFISTIIIVIGTISILYFIFNSYDEKENKFEWIKKRLEKINRNI